LLPYSKGSNKPVGTSGDPGGTVAEKKATMLVPIAATVLVTGGIIAFFATRRHDSSEPRDAAVAEVLAPAEAAPPTTPVASPSPTPPLVRRQAAAPSPISAAADLEKQLRHVRLWSTVVPTGARVDIRSATCNDPNMAATIEAATAPLRTAGLTRLRCLEESGRVVFERDL
jgi:hypothetical protein